MQVVQRMTLRGNFLTHSQAHIQQTCFLAVPINLGLLRIAQEYLGMGWNGYPNLAFLGIA